MKIDLSTPQVFTPPADSRLSYTRGSFDASKNNYKVTKLARYIVATSLLPIFLLIDAARLMASPFRSKRQYTALEQMNYASGVAYSNMKIAAKASKAKIESSAKSLAAFTLENKSTILKVAAGVTAVAVTGALVYAYTSNNAVKPNAVKPNAVKLKRKMKDSAMCVEIKGKENGEVYRYKNVIDRDVSIQNGETVFNLRNHTKVTPLDEPSSFGFNLRNHTIVTPLDEPSSSGISGSLIFGAVAAVASTVTCIAVLAKRKGMC